MVLLLLFFPSVRLGQKTRCLSAPTPARSVDLGTRSCFASAVQREPGSKQFVWLGWCFAGLVHGIGMVRGSAESRATRKKKSQSPGHGSGRGRDAPGFAQAVLEQLGCSLQSSEELGWSIGVFNHVQLHPCLICLSASWG